MGQIDPCSAKGWSLRKTSTAWFEKFRLQPILILILLKCANVTEWYFAQIWRMIFESLLLKLLP